MHLTEKTRCNNIFEKGVQGFFTRVRGQWAYNYHHIAYVICLSFLLYQGLIVHVQELLAMVAHGFAHNAVSAVPGPLGEYPHLWTST